MTKAIDFVCNQVNCIHCGVYSGCKLDTVILTPAVDGSNNISCGYFQQKCTEYGCRNKGKFLLSGGKYYCTKHYKKENEG